MTTITIDRRLLEQALAAIQELEYASTAVSDKKARDAKQSIRAALAAPATESDERAKELETELAATEVAIAEYRQQCLDNAQEIARLRAESEERLQNCVALVAENERLRKDAERLDYIEESGNFGVTRYRSGPGGPVLIEAEDGKKDISKSASSLRDAIDSVIKEAKGTP